MTAVGARPVPAGRGIMNSVPRLGSEAPLIGRTDELSRLVTAVRDARSGRPAAVLLAGDAGVGKTRLLTELATRAEADGVIVLTGHCVDLGAVGLPYLPFTEALTQLTELAGSHPAVAEALRARPAVGPLIPGHGTDAAMPLGDDDVGQLQLFDAVSGLLGQVAAAQALLLIIEDLHWADQSTRNMLSFLLTRLRSERLAVIASYRADDLHRRHPLRPMLSELVRLPAVERLDLVPFTDDQMHRYLRALRPGRLPEGVERGIVERSEGNPYFAEELLATVDDYHGTLPVGLADVLLARLERLPASVQQIARVAAVAGRSVTHRLLQAAGDLSGPELEATLREAVAHHVLVPDGRDRYVFRHALLLEAVYGDLLPGERVRLHGRYAELIAESRDSARPLGSAAELAYHYMESHDLPGALAASVRAADEASQMRAPTEKLRHLERALQLWPSVPDAEAIAGTDPVRLGLQAATTAARAGDLQRAVALAREASERDPADPADPRLAAFAHQQHAHHLLGVDRFEASVAEARAALALVGDEPSWESAWSHATAARGALYLDQDEDAHRHATQAIAGARAAGVADAEADALVTLASLENANGRPDAAHDLLTRAIDRAESACDLSVRLRGLTSLAANRFYQGELADALRIIDTGMALADQAGLTWFEWGVELRVLQVITRYLQGDWDGSLRAAELAGDRLPHRVAAKFAAAALYVRVGRGVDGTAERITRLRTSPSAGDWHTSLLTCGTRIDLLRWSGDYAGALAAALDTIDWVSRGWEPYSLAGIWLSALGIGALADQAELDRLHRRDTEVAAAVTEGRRIVEYARTTAVRGRPRGGTLGPEGRGWLAVANAEWARLDGHDDPELWQAAVDEFATWYPYEEARGRWHLAAALLAGDQRDKASAQVREAYQIAERLGATPLRDALTELARRGRLDAGLPVREYPNVALTARERDVLALLAEGRTNRQIGRTLFISEKTVSVHVSNLMGKLGASGRTEAVAIASRRGLLS